MSEIQSLTLEVRANSDKATRSLDALAASLNKLKGSATGSNLGKVASDLKQIRESGTRTSESTRQTSEGIEKTGQAAGHATGKLSALAASLKGVMSGTASLGAALKGVGSSLFKVASQAGTAAAKGIRGIVTAPFSVAAAGVRGIAAAFNALKDKVSLSNTALGKLFSAVKRIAMYRLIRSAIKMVTEGVKEGIENLYKWSDAMNGSFASAMDTGSAASLQFKNSIAAMLGPAIEAVIPLLVTLANVAIQAANAINMFISALFGRATWTRAKEVSAGATKSLKGAGKAAKDADDKIKGLLADWDELNIIQNESSKDPNGGSGGGGGGGISAEDMFENVPLGDNWWTDLGSRLREAIAAGDWEGAGNILAKKLNEVVDKIEPEKWAGKLRDTISKGISFAIGFLDEFDFKGFGRKFGRFLTEMFSANSEDMWDRIGTYLKLRFMGMIQFAAGVFEDPTLFTGIGTSLATMLDSAFDLNDNDVKDIAAAIGGVITGAANAATSFFTTADFESIGAKVNAILVEMFGDEGTIDGNAIGNAIKSAIESGAKFVSGVIGTEASNPFESLAGTISTAINKVFSFTGKEIDDLAYAVSMTINRAVKGVSTFLTETNFKSIGDTVKQFLVRALGKDGYIDAASIGTALKDAVLAGFDTVDSLLGEDNGGIFKRLAESAAEFINGVFDLDETEKAKIPEIFGKAVKDAFDGVERFFSEVNWSKIGDDIKYWIENIDWEGIGQALVNALTTAFSAVEEVGGQILLGLYNTIARAWNNLVGDLIELFPSLAAPLFGDSGAFEGWMETGNVEGLMQKLDGKYYMVSGTQARNLGETEAYTDAMNAATQAVEDQTSALDDLNQALETTTETTSIEIKQPFNRKTARGLGNKDTTDIQDTVNAATEADAALTNIQSTIEETETSFVELMATLNQTVTDSSVGEVVAEQTSEAVEEIGEFSEEAEQSFVELWQSLYGTVTETDIEGAVDEAIPDALPIIDTVSFEQSMQNAANTAIACANSIASAISAINGMSLNGLSVSMPGPIRMAASGGVMTTGQMFIAREAGPEYVGTMGNHTAVANNEQIVAGISSGVASANAEQNALLRQQNSLLTQLLNKEFTAKAVPSSAWGRFQQQSNDMYARQTGRG